MLTNTPGINPAAIQFSLFTTPVSRGPHRAETWTLADLHNAIRSGHWWDVIAPVREIARHKQEKDESGKRKSALAQQYSNLKDQTLPYAVFSGTWDPRHRHADGHACKSDKCPGNGLLQPSGLRLLDIDDLHDDEGEWIFAAIDEGTLPWAAAAWTSTGGDGIHIVSWLDPAPTNQATSHAAYAALARDLAINLPGIEVANDTSSKNLMRPAFVSADSTARLRENATPFRWMDAPAPQGTPNRFEPPKAYTEPPVAPRDADRQLVLNALNAMAQHQVGSQHDESHLLATMANMKAFGFTFAEFDEWAADAGCTCKREPRWQQPPASNQSDRPGRAIINLAAKHYGYEKPRPDQPIPDAEPEANPQIVPHRWFEIGQWIAERILIPDFAYVPQENHEPAWWQWIDGCRWSILSTNSHTIADRLHARQFTLAARLKADGNEEAANMVGNHRAWTAAVGGNGQPLWAGIRAACTRTLELPPNHVIAVRNGVLNMREGVLHPHDPGGPYLITAVTSGAYRPELIDTLRPVIDARLAPALPRPEQRDYLYKCNTIMLGGASGGNDRGSLLYLAGTSGGGKGNTANMMADAAGTHAITANADAMYAKGDINDTMARILERAPRILFFHEAERMPMGKIMSLTGGDPMSARGPNKPIIERRLATGVVVTSVQVPKGKMDTGAKRRLAAIMFTGKARVTRTSATSETTQPQRDALITVALLDAITMWRSPDEWTTLPDQDPDAARAAAAADPVEAAIDAIEDDQVSSILADVIERMKADEDTGKEPDIQKLTPRALSVRINARTDWTTCKHKGPDGKEGARLWRPGGCPCDQSQASQPGFDDLAYDEVAATQNPRATQNIDFEGGVTRVKDHPEKDHFASRDPFASRPETPFQHQTAPRDPGYDEE